jgi:hypothetical protein
MVLVHIVLGIVFQLDDILVNPSDRRWHLQLEIFEGDFGDWHIVELLDLFFRERLRHSLNNTLIVDESLKHQLRFIVMFIVEGHMLVLSTAFLGKTTILSRLSFSL